MEEWRDIPGYEGAYQVSSLGNVRSIRWHKPMVLKPSKMGRGYLQCHISYKGKEQYLYVHRIVAMAFVTNEDNRPYVNHIDGNKTNNDADNLEWVEPYENTYHAMASGLWQKEGEVNGKKDSRHKKDDSRTVVESA